MELCSIYLWRSSATNREGEAGYIAWERSTLIFEILEPDKGD